MSTAEGGEEEQPIVGPSTLYLPEVTSQQQACALLLCAIQHLFYAKGQVYEPISVLQSRRARENISEAQVKSRMELAGIMRPRGKSVSVQKRRQMRKTDELLSAIQLLQRCITTAIAQLQQADQLLEETIFHFQLGQSRLSCRQQVCIKMRGLSYLKCKELALQDAKIRRQKMSNMEKKLIRFLLCLSAEDEAFIGMLNKSISLSRAHISVLAPATFSCRGWTRYKALKKEELELHTPTELSSSAGQNHSDHLTDIKMEQSILTFPSEMQNKGAKSGVESPSDDIDARRLQRMEQRAMQRVATHQRGTSAQLLKGRKAKKKVPTNATFSIDFRPLDTDEKKEELDRGNLYWFVCKTVLKGVS